MSILFVSPHPFSSAEASVFRSLLRTANMEEYPVANVFAEAPPDKKIKNWCVGKKSATELGITDLPPIGPAGFLLPEYRDNLKRLYDEVVKAQPTVIVPLGGTALWAFTGVSNITQVRGTVVAAERMVPGIKVVPSFHPSYIIKKWQHFAIVVRDMQFAKLEAEKGKEIEHATRSLILEPTQADIDHCTALCLGSPLISLDIETGWGQITCIGFAWTNEDAICIPFVDLRRPNKSYWGTAEEECAAWRAVRSVCESGVPKVGQNFAGYDLIWLLLKHGISVRNMMHDTRLLSHAIYPELPKDLGFLGSAYTTQGAWKHMGRKGEKRDDNSQFKGS